MKIEDLQNIYNKLSASEFQSETTLTKLSDKDRYICNDMGFGYNFTPDGGIDTRIELRITKYHTEDEMYEDFYYTGNDGILENSRKIEYEKDGFKAVCYPVKRQCEGRYMPANNRYISEVFIGYKNYFIKITETSCWRIKTNDVINELIKHPDLEYWLTHNMGYVANDGEKAIAGSDFIAPQRF